MTSIKDKDLDSVLNDLFGPVKGPSQKLEPTSTPNNDGGWKEIDLTSIMGGMIPSVVNQPLQGPGIPSKGYQYIPKQEVSGPPTVYLREGLKSYRKLEVEAPIPVAVEVGPIHNVIGREFEYVGKIKVYLVENINKPINLSSIDHNKLLTLVMVRAPFVGTMLVPENAIVKVGPQTKQVLRD